MPIRINLLAEQQAAEDARRRDPVKRALWAGGALVAVLVLWAVSLQFRVTVAKAALTGTSSRLQSLEDNSTEARQRWAEASSVESRLENLRRYTTNRFLCATALDALQQLEVDDVRVVHLQTAHAYASNAPAAIKTNLVVPLAAGKGWQFWKSSPPPVDVASLVSNQVNVLTNKLGLNPAVPFTAKVEVKTNATQATATIEIVKPATAAERIVLTIKARDYSNPPGRRVDEFSRALARHPYFARLLQEGEGQGIRLRERAIQPEVDLADAVHPGRPFVPFVIECRYRETLRANE